MVWDRCALSSAMLLSLSLGISQASESPANPWRNHYQSESSEPVFVSDEDDSDYDVDEYGVTEFDYEMDADFGYVEPAQYRAGANAGRTPASPASLARQGQRTPQSFNVRLARVPNMMGDFFGITTGGSYTNMESFVGEGIHHILGSTGGANDIHLIEFTDSSREFAVYVGGPSGSVPGSFFTPGPSPPAPTRIEGLTSNIPGEFVAVKNGDFTDVYVDDNSLSGPPDIGNAEVFDVYQVIHVGVPSVGPGDIVGRVRLQENNSAMPQDRVFFDYNFFNNVPLTTTDIDVQRFAPGAEKTFFNGNASIELRVPVGLTINSNSVAGGPFDTSNGEMGNLVVAPKVLLYSNGESAFAIGCGVAIPTADDINVNMMTGTPLLRIENEAVHLLPYLAYLYSPSDAPLFVHAFVATDFALNGNPVFADVNGGGITQLGTLTEQNLISGHFSIGSWLYQNRSNGSRLNGVAWTGEIHYTNTLNDGDSLTGANYTIGDPNAELSLVNATVGGHVRMGMTTFTLGYCTPISDDRVFDGELRCFVNRNF